MKTEDTKTITNKFGGLAWLLAGAGGVLLLGYLVRKSSGAKSMPRFAGMGAGPISGDDKHKLEPNWHEGRDAVEEASWESFPASDPPSF